MCFKRRDMIRVNFIILIISFFYLHPARANESQACDENVISAVAGWAKLKGEAHPVVSGACKAMPGKADTIIAAIAFDENGMPAEEGGVKIEVIALLKNGGVLAATRKEITEDSSTSVGQSSYTIDTAPYRISPDVRAFGVIFDSASRGPSCPEYFAGRELTLWVKEGDKLRPVFGTNLYGWINLDNNWCNKKFESASFTISVEKTTSHGFADLLLTAHVARVKDADGEYVETNKRTVKKVFHYDGVSYGTDMFNEFWYPKL